MAPAVDHLSADARALLVRNLAAAIVAAWRAQQAVRETTHNPPVNPDSPAALMDSVRRIEP
jgi:hypothetical protein